MEREREREHEKKKKQQMKGQDAFDRKITKSTKSPRLCAYACALAVPLRLRLAMAQRSAIPAPRLASGLKRTRRAPFKTIEFDDFTLKEITYSNPNWMKNCKR